MNSRQRRGAHGDAGAVGRRGDRAVRLRRHRRTRVVFLARVAALAAFVGAAVGLGSAMRYVGILWANVIGTATGSAVVIAVAMMRPAQPATMQR